MTGDGPEPASPTETAPLRSGSSPRRRSWLLGVAALLVLAVVSWLLFLRPERFEHAEGAGPLSSQTSSGSTSMYAPGKKPWTGTFGSYLLCSTTGEAITVEGIRIRTPVEPINVEQKLRKVSQKARSADPALTYLGGSLGAAPDLPDGRLPGSYQPFEPGVRIEQNCSDLDRSSASFTELLFVLRVGDAGGLIDRVWVDYQVGGEEYTLRIEWQMIACGESIPQVDGREVCDGTAE